MSVCSWATTVYIVWLLLQLKLSDLLRMTAQVDLFHHVGKRRMHTVQSHFGELQLSGRLATRWSTSIDASSDFNNCVLRTNEVLLAEIGRHRPRVSAVKSRFSVVIIPQQNTW